MLLGPSVPSLQQALAALYARVPLGMRLGLEPMQDACARTGHPERAFEVVHVAGTNGKGSVSAMVEAALRASGKKTGLYTSPHLARFAERMVVNGEPLSEDALTPLLDDALTRGADLSFFETATLAAFLAFRDAKVDVAVVEVGLGGRLDATNVVPPPRVAAITRIALDHTDRLGTTPVEIAREKAGIAKKGVPIVLGPMQPEVRVAIDEVAYAAGATTCLATEDRQAVTIATDGPLGLEGDYQRDNAIVACAVSRLAGASALACAKGLADARWPGRLETVKTARGDALLDAAHNPDGIASLTRHLSRLGKGRERVAIVFGVLADKAWQEMVDLVAKEIPARIYVAPTGRAPVPVDALRARHEGEVARSVEEAIDKAFAKVGREGLVVVAGSILLVGEARALLLGLPRDPPVAL
jgi:dihydrofolate synthase / folylpolyglutamate synthase